MTGQSQTGISQPSLYPVNNAMTSEDDGGIEMGSLSPIVDDVDVHDLTKEGCLEDDEMFSDDACLLKNEAGEVSGRKHALASVEEDGNSKLASTPKMVVNLFISFVGAGVLGLPYAYKRAGVIEGTVILALVATISIYAMTLIVKLKRMLAEYNVTSYGDIGYRACGNPGALLVDFCLVVTQTGFSCAYLIFISTNVEQLTGINGDLVVAACIPVLAGLSLTRHLGSLAPFSLFADVCNFVGLLSVYMVDFEMLRPEVEAQVVGAHLGEFFFFFGVAIYCYEGAGIVLSLENSMRNKDQFIPTLVGVASAVSFIYISFGVAGYYAFGNSTQDIITLNLQGSWAGTVVKVCLCMGLYFTYPMAIYPVIETMERYVSCVKTIDSSEDLTPKDPDASPTGKGYMLGLESRRNVLRIGFVCSTGLIAVGIPNFGLFISLIGSSAGSLVGFILPAFFHLKLHWGAGRPLHWSLALLDIVLIVLGVVAAVLGTMDAGRSLMNHYHMQVEFEETGIEAVADDHNIGVADVVDAEIEGGEPIGGVVEDAGGVVEDGGGRF